MKPENVLIRNDQVKIADFGWSNMNDDFRNTYCGTPDYLSPEMILGTGHDEKLDIWTLGVLMFEMLSGSPPFEVRDVMEKRKKQKLIENNILKGEIKFPEYFSSEAKNTITILLNPDPKKRPQAKDLLNLEFFKMNTIREVTSPQ